MPGYKLAGFSIESALVLPLPEASLSPQGADFFLEVGPRLSEDESPEHAEWNWPSADEANLSFPDLGRAWISRGERILFRPSAGSASRTEWRGLMIPCFAALFHQRGDLSLHASAVCIGGGAVGFMGDRGAGKSTIVAQLVGEKVPFLCDDLLLLGEDPENKGFVAYPGFSIIKLWENSRKAAGGGFSRIGRLYPRIEKEGFSPSGSESAASPAPLECLFVLDEGDEVKVESLSRREALSVLLQQTYGVRVFERKPLPVHFRQCGELAAKVPVKRLIRPKDFECAAEVERAVFEALSEGTAPAAFGGAD